MTVAEPLPQPPASTRRPRWRRGVLWGFVLLLVLLMLPVGGVLWVLTTSPGLQTGWSLLRSHLPAALEIEGVQGRLIGPLRIERLRYAQDGQRLEIDDVVLRWGPRALFERRVELESVQIQRLAWFPAPSEDSPPAGVPPLPGDLRLPFALRLGLLEVARIELHSAAANLSETNLVEENFSDSGLPDPGSSDPGEAQSPAQNAPLVFADLRLRLESDGRQHRVQEFTLNTPWGATVLNGNLDGQAPFALQFEGQHQGQISIGADQQADQQADLRADWQAEGTLEALKLQATAALDEARARVEIRAAPFTSRPLHSLVLALEALDPKHWLEGAPAGLWSLELQLDAVAEGGEGQPGGDGVALAGPLDWPMQGELRVLNAQPNPLDAGGLPVSGLRSHLQIGEGRVQASELVAELLGNARLEGSAEWAPTVAGAAEDVPATLDRFRLDLNLVGLDLRALDARLPVSAGAGRLQVGGDRQQQFVELELAESLANVLQALASPEGSKDGGQGSALKTAEKSGLQLQLQARREGEELALQRLQLRMGEAELSAHGQLALGGEMPFALALEMRSVDPQALFASGPAGRLALDAELQGKLAQPEIHAQWKIPALGSPRLAGLPLSGAGRVHLQGDRLPLAEIRLGLGSSRFAADGAWGRAGDELALDFALPVLAELAPLLRQFGGMGALGEEKLSGSLSGRAKVAGTLQQPSGELSLTAEALHLPGGVNLRDARATAQVGGRADSELSAQIVLNELRIAGQERELDSLRLEIDGLRSAHRITLQAVSGEDRVALQLAGALDAGAESGSLPAWRGEIASLRIEGLVDAELEAPASLRASAQRAELGELALRLGNGRLSLTQTAWSPQGIQAQGRLQGLTIAASDPRRRRAEPLVVGGDWTLDLGRSANGQINLYREAGDVMLDGERRVALGLEEARLALRIEDAVVSAVLQVAGETLGELQAEAQTQLSRSAAGGWELAPDAQLRGSGRVKMPDLAWLGLLIHPELMTRGTLQAEFALSGTRAAPLLEGRVRGESLVLELAEHGLRLQDGVLDLLLAQDRMVLEQLLFQAPVRVLPRDVRLAGTPAGVPLLSGLSGARGEQGQRISHGASAAVHIGEPGTLSVQGELSLEDGRGGFDILADSLALLQREDRWLRVSGNGRIVLEPERVNVGMSVTVNDGYVEMPDTPAPSLSEDVVVLTGKEGEAGAPEGGVRATELNIGLDLGERMFVSALGLDARLTGGLLLSARPGVALRGVGSIVARDGVFEGYGQKLAIDRGAVNFQGALDNPGLNIRALRRGLAVEAGVEIVGSARRPVVRLVSEPNVPDPEKLSWIVLGRAPDTSAGAADYSLLIPAAQALLGADISRELAGSLGFDQISIGQGDVARRMPSSSVVGGGNAAGDSGAAGQVLTVGRRLSNQLTLAFEQSLGSAESLIKLTYQLSRRITLVVRAGSDQSVDLNYTWAFR